MPREVPHKYHSINNIKYIRGEDGDRKGGGRGEGGELSRREEEVRLRGLGGHPGAQ